ncbi:MAG: PAS domain S-box protein [Bacteroidetes bacterium]|jgi:PAS domain S-box-containing protein|nr:PAS domain S-box protein [Bacteroidota bacterium]
MESLSASAQNTPAVVDASRKYENIFGAFDLGSMLVQADGTIIAASADVAEDLGYEVKQLQNKRIFEINPHLSLIKWKRLWKKLQQEGRYELETEHMTVQEMLFPVKLRAVPLPINGEDICLLAVKNLLQANRYRKLLDLTTTVSQVGGWEWDLVNDELLFTDEMYHLLETSPDSNDLTDKATLAAFLETHLPEQQQKSFDRQLRGAVETGQEVAFEFVFRRGDGSYKRMAIKAFPEQSELQTIKLYGTLQDISVFDKKHEDLQLTQYTLDHAREMIFWETEDGRFLYANNAVYETLGYSPQDIQSIGVWDLVYDYSGEERTTAWADLRKKGKASMEIDLKSKDGERVTVFTSMSLIDYKGQEINCVFARDWRRKKARDKQLRLSQVTLDNAVDMIFWVTRQGDIAYVNERVYEQLGFTAYGHWSDFFPDTHLNELWSDLKSKGRVDWETTLKRSDGSAFPVEVQMGYVGFEGEEYGCAFMRDITVRREKSEELEQALAKVQELSEQLQRENTLLKAEIDLSANFNEIITQDKRYKRVLQQVEQVAHTDATVLLVGETGTGKELLARSIRKLSARADKPMIKVNCAALPKDLIESELFGHEKGAFTGAHERKKGRFEMADGGTLFLDEVGEMPLELQSKLLRVLQEGEFQRVGGTETLSVDVRVIAATNRNLMEMVDRGDFREDLYYRLNVFPIHNIPLRERREDIPLLVRFFVKKYAEKAGKAIEHISQSGLDQLMQYEFPGNIRELENIVERAVILSPGNSLNLEDSFNAEDRQKGGTNKVTTFKSFEDMQRDYIIEALRRCNWRISGPKGAARLLQLNSRTLASKMRRLGIRRKDFIE